MSETVVTIHYKNTGKACNDPRPTRIQFDADGEIITTVLLGDKVLTWRDQLIGLSRQDPTPGGHGLPDGETVRNIYGPPESFDPENWVGAEDLISERRSGVRAEGETDVLFRRRGWFPVFRTEDGEWVYTRRWPVDRVEVTVR